MFVFNHAPDHQRPYIARARFVLAALVRVGRLRALGTIIDLCGGEINLPAFLLKLFAHLRHAFLSLRQGCG